MWASGRLPGAGLLKEVRVWWESVVTSPFLPHGVLLRHTQQHEVLFFSQGKGVY